MTYRHVQLLCLHKEEEWNGVKQGFMLLLLFFKPCIDELNAFVKRVVPGHFSTGHIISLASNKYSIKDNIVALSHFQVHYCLTYNLVDHRPCLIELFSKSHDKNTALSAAQCAVHKSLQTFPICPCRPWTCES